jgi:iron complex outermembrane recepter protein
MAFRDTHGFKLLGTAAVWAIMATSAASAQTSSTDADENPSGIKEIVVTAQLRSQSLIDVPLTVTALTAETLADNRIENFADLARITPGFVSAPNYGFIRNSSMRGISNNQFGFADDPSIAIFTDGVYQGRGGTGSIVNALYDVERVEVIKGPQATLFGRSSIGGAINTILNQPAKGESFGNVEFGLGERDIIVGRAAANVPLTENLTLRIAGHAENRGGYLTNLNGNSKLGPLQVAAGRAILRYEADNGLDISLKAGIEDREQSGSVYQQIGLPKFTVQSTLRGREAYSDFSIKDAVLRFRFPISDALSVTATTSYRDVENQYVEDYDGIAAVVGGPYSQTSDDRLFQQDLILNYESGAVSIVAGGSYFSEKLDATVANYANQTFAFTGSPDPGLRPSDYSLAMFESGNLRGKFHGYSFFIDGSFEPVEGLTITGGARYNYDKKRFTQDITDPAKLPQSALIFPGAFYNWGYFTSVPITSEKAWKDLAFRAAIDYAVAPDVSIYAAFNQGWKAGGIDSFKVVTPAPFPLFFGLDAAAAGGVPNVYDPEQSDSYEVGLKGRFFDRKLLFNLSLYEYRYRDLQVSIPQGGSSVIANVGRARGRGVELETQLKPASWLDLFANGAYNDTKITRFDELPLQVGLPLNQAPKWTAAFGGTITASLADSGSIAFGGTVSYRSSYRNDNQLGNGVEAQTLTNLRLSWSDAEDKLSIGAYLDNVFNVVTYARFNQARLFLFPVASRSVLGEPRTFGVNVKAKF